MLRATTTTIKKTCEATRIDTVVLIKVFHKIGQQRTQPATDKKKMETFSGPSETFESLRTNLRRDFVGLC